MKYIDLENLAKEGKLIVNKSFARKATKTLYVYEEDKLDWINTKEIKFDVHRYSAQTEGMDNAWWKITSKDYKNLIGNGAKVKNG